MRYRELLEGKNKFDLFDKIIKNCEPFLQEINYDVSETVLYRGLGGEAASGYDDAKIPNTPAWAEQITGAALPIDGGWTAQ